ncbi:MAG TPA: glycosyltransferase [Solirubrobacterales bacterium]|nr:glycosyltransferase [Solirubrobacterales bacterium]
MIGFGCAVTEDEDYERYALPGIELAAEPDSERFVYGAIGSVFRSYNMLLDKARDYAREHGDLEALVVIHQDAEIIDPDFLPKVREAMRDPDVALVGCAGAIDVRSIAWWEGSVTWASFTHRFGEYGGGDLPALSWIPEKIPVYAETGEVDSIDGFVIAFSPWAIENLRFDETIGGVLHGYDFDICMQARAAGKKVVTADLRVIHHHSLVLITGVDSWMEAHIKLSEKWHDHLPVTSLDWRRRARLAEAELAAIRLGAGAGEMIWEHRLAAIERDLEQIQDSVSWRITKPLRWFARLLRGGRQKQEEPKEIRTFPGKPAPVPGGAPKEQLSDR